MNYVEMLESLSQDLQQVNASVQTHKHVQNIVHNYTEAVKKYEANKEKESTEEDIKEEE